MKTHTNKEIENKLTEIFKDEGYNTEIEIIKNKSSVDLKISREYSAPKLRFKQLNELAKFFDTLNVETESEFANGGCDTCDYGSSYGFILRVSEGDPYNEIVDEN